jgi:hypothetical protein
VSHRRLSSWLPVGVAVFVVLGHVCALPVHVHAGAVTTDAEDHPEHGGDKGTHGGRVRPGRPSALRQDRAWEGRWGRHPMMFMWCAGVEGSTAHSAAK